MKEKWHWALVIVVCAAIGAATNGLTAKSSADPTAPSMAQDVVFLDRRINMLEQRFYSMESRMNRLEQQMSMALRAVPAPTPSQPTRDPTIDLLRGESESLKVRLRELECGILRLDERTLSERAKEARRRAGAQSKDPCRAEPEVPIKLSVRP
ncbi:MAG TPA: hypothetical protein VGV87_29645 [Blastocatellia bacterium]|nr:hypothetical protein [Blastocatellia bacterium]